MENSATTIVSSEDDAWELLARWNRRESIGEVEFKNWPILQINIKGEDFNSSLNSSQMAALVDFKKTIARAYSSIAHGSYDMRRLKAEEEEQLEFSTCVKKGSSLTDTDLTPLVQALASAVNTHPTATLAAAIIIGLALVAKPVILKHYENRAKQIDADERIRLIDLSLTAREQKQYALFESSVAKLEKIYPQLSKVLPDAASGFWRFASASANADVMSVAGIELSQDDLEILSERRQNRPTDIAEIEQEFMVVGVTKHHNIYRIQLTSQNLNLSATYRHPQLTDTRVRRLMNCMSTSTPILAKLEVKVVDKSQVSGRLMRFKPLSGEVE